MASNQHPLMQLSDEDREFIVRMVLASGSLKALAAQYGVSYPTIRQRLDHLIERLQALVDQRPRDPLADLLADLVESGELTHRAAKRILKTHRDNKHT